MLKPGLLKIFFLILPDPEKSYILETDVSDYAMRGTLEQKINEKFHPVTFYSRKFINAEFNYEIYNKKLLNSLLDDPSFIISKEFLLFNGLVYIPFGLRTEIFTENHNNSMTRH